MLHQEIDTPSALQLEELQAELNMQYRLGFVLLGLQPPSFAAYVEIQLLNAREYNARRRSNDRSRLGVHDSLHIAKILMSASLYKPQFATHE